MWTWKEKSAYSDKSTLGWLFVFNTYWGVGGGGNEGICKWLCKIVQFPCPYSLFCLFLLLFFAFCFVLFSVCWFCSWGRGIAFSTVSASPSACGGTLYRTLFLFGFPKKDFRPPVLSREQVLLAVATRLFRALPWAPSLASLHSGPWAVGLRPHISGSEVTVPNHFHLTL